MLERTPGDRPALKLNAMSWEVMRGQRAVTLLQAKESRSRRTRIEEISWRDVDEALFENLRKLRREIAAERGVPAYVILHDATLRELASVKPATIEDLRRFRGIGERKLTDFGARVIECIKSQR
jgi:ATP-dependent DNA helicase RecQ